MNIGVESSTACNAKCSFCPNSIMTRMKGEMSDELFYKIVKDGKAINISSFMPYLNGEPFIFPRIWNWLDYLRDEEVWVTIYTNAEFLEVDKLIRYPNIRYINCSFNAATEDSFSKVSPGLHYERCKVNIEDLISRAKFPVRVSMVVVEENIKEVAKFSEMWGRYSCFATFKNWTGDKYSTHRQQGTRQPCWSLRQSMSILWDGRVVACCMDYDGKLILGDVNKNTLREIWHESRWLREMHRQHDFSTPICATCNYNKG